MSRRHGHRFHQLATSLTEAPGIRGLASRFLEHSAGPSERALCGRHPRRVRGNHPGQIPIADRDFALPAHARKDDFNRKPAALEHGHRHMAPSKRAVQIDAPSSCNSAKWQQISWRHGTKGKLTCLFAARRVRVAEGHRHRMIDGRVQAMPGEQDVWFVDEKRTTGEQKYDLSNLPADATLKTLAAAIKARWLCEQAHQQLKEEHGLDHFEGRSWTGLSRHCLMAMIAFAFLQSRCLKAAGRKKEQGGHRHSRRCRPSGKPSLILSYDHRPHDALTAINPSPSLLLENCQSRARSVISAG